jgi:hypothetical protein
MPWRRYLAEHTPGDHLVWWAFFNMHRWTDVAYRDPSTEPPDLSMDGLVPPETQARWAGRVAGAKFALLTKRADELGGRPMTEAERANREAAVRAQFNMAARSGVSFGDDKERGS